MTDEIKYKFHFMKRGPEPSEFYDCLTSKMDGFIIDLSEPEWKRAISIVTKRVCIRQNITDPTKVDRRRYANRLYIHRGLLPDHNESPQKAAEDSSRRGVRKFTKKIHDKYKAKQKTLLAYFDHCFGSRSTRGFCNYIDQHTLSIIKLPVDGLTSANLEILMIMLDLCEYVVMGRLAVDWAQPNNLIIARGWNNWREHMCVLISFAAMLTALFMVLSKLKRCHAMAIYSCCVGIFPIVFVADFIHRSYYISCNLINPQMGMPFCIHAF